MCLPVKPYQIEKEWEHAGLKCAVTLSGPHGHRCGYVRIPPGPGNLLHGLNSCGDFSKLEIDVHGGFTFGELEPCGHEDGVGFWIGFDFAHAGDALYEPGHDPYRVDERFGYIGWYPNSNYYWKHEEVVRETELVAEQLAGILKS